MLDAHERSRVKRTAEVRISDVRVRLVSCPYPSHREWHMGYGTQAKRDAVFVFIDTDAGVTGIGEAYHAYAPTIVAAIVEQHLRPIVLGQDPFAIDDLWHRMFFSTLQLGSGAVSAISGVDIALWDAAGKLAGEPVYRLLGGAGTTRVPAYVGNQCLGWQEPDDLAREASSYVEDGFRAVKIRGGQGVDRDVEAVAAVREAVGADVDVLIDANSTYSWPEAVRLGRLLEGSNTFWLEDPFDFTVKYHPRDMGRLRERTATPISSGGNIYTRFQYRDLIELGGVDYVTPDVGKAGGISEALKIAHMASAMNVLVAPHSSPGLGVLAAMHMCAATPQHVMSYLEWDAAPFNPPRDELLSKPIVVEDGFLVLPDGPGLGSELSEDALDEYAYVEGLSITMAPRRRRWHHRPTVRK